MPPDNDGSGSRGRSYTQLLRQQGRTLQVLSDLKKEIDAPATRELIRRLRSTRGGAVEEAFTSVVKGVEDTLRAVHHCQSEIQRELARPLEELPEDGPDNLPPALIRFLAERSESPGFSYEVRRDENRGWVIHWKEYTERGTVRGSGQFYERPYAWIDD